MLSAQGQANFDSDAIRGSESLLHSSPISVSQRRGRPQARRRGGGAAYAGQSQAVPVSPLPRAFKRFTPVCDADELGNLHGVLRMIAPDEQLKVPMWLWLSPVLRTHEALFGTVLGLMRVETSARLPGEDLLASCRGVRRTSLPAP